MLLMIFALSRGFVVQQFGELSPFSTLHAFAEGSGGGGAGGGGSGGGGAGGGGSGGGGAGGGGSGGGGAGGGGASASASGGGGFRVSMPTIYGCMDSRATNYNPAATSQFRQTCIFPPAPVIGCMDPTATNFNPAATSQTGVTCTYPPAPPVIGCMDPTATNFDPAATSQTGVTCTYPPPPPGPAAPVCALSASPTSLPVGGGVTTLSWTSTDATTFSISNGIGAVAPVAAGSTSTLAISADTSFTGTATGAGGSATCTAAVTVATNSGGGGGGGGGGGSTGGGGGGGGGGTITPTITLTALPHVSPQPLAYLYLSQIPYTGLELGPVGTVLYWIALVGWALALAYLVLFGIAPAASRYLRSWGASVSDALNSREMAFAVAPSESQTFRNATPEPPVHAPVVAQEPHLEPAAPREYSTYEGFKSFAHNGALSIEDIVKSLSRQSAAQPRANVEPVYQNVEPIRENVEPIEDEPVVAAPASARDSVRHADSSVTGFAAALLEGDREAVFAGLRQHIRGGGAPEQLLSSVACLIDDVYRARIDGTSCGADLARLSARLDTPTLERLVASLATAIDSSYSTGVTGAKLALTRALAVLGV